LWQRIFSIVAMMRFGDLFHMSGTIREYDALALPGLDRCGDFTIIET